MTDAVLMIIDWMDGNYMRSLDCWMGDNIWIGHAIACNIAVIIGYLMIAMQFRKASRATGVHDGDGNAAMRSMMWVFLLCGVCGYCFHTIAFWWPGHRLFTCVKVALVLATWGFVIHSHGMNIIVARLAFRRTPADIQSELDTLNATLAKIEREAICDEVRATTRDAMLHLQRMKVTL